MEVNVILGLSVLLIVLVSYFAIAILKYNDQKQLKVSEGESVKTGKAWQQVARAGC